MNLNLAVSLALGGTMLIGSGCATKKYVRETAAPIQTKVDQVADTTTKQGAAIDDTRKEVKQVDERATTGISAAKERAMTAENRANEAMTKANDAGKAAADAKNAADKSSSEVAQLRQVVGNLDDYKVAGETTVMFAFNKDKLTDESKQKLDALVADKNKYKRFMIAVEGFTDKTGSAEYNAALSRRRANHVVEYLVSKHDIPIYRIHMIGLGPDKLVDEGRGREARAKNRRVEVKIFSADQASTVSQAR